jgi:hypothetical protein
MNHDIMNFLKKIVCLLDPTIWRECHILQSYFTENSYSSIKANMDPFEN